MRFLLCSLAVLLLALPASAVTIDWVTVGDPGNACDPQRQRCFGTVDYTYRISKYDVTVAQYAEFLNAVAAVDTHGLWSLGNDVAREGTSGSFTYTPNPGRESLPVVSVSFWDAARFANWMHNGQPRGFQDSTTTEGGAYSLTLAGISDNSVERRSDAQIFLPSENEWFKAAYYDSGSQTYFDYPTSSNLVPICSEPTSAPNHANCNGVVGDRTPVGSYSGSGSPHGTLDQGHNVAEFNDTIFGDGRIIQGTTFNTSPLGSGADAIRGGYFGIGYGSLGFRLAAVIPEPSTALLVGGGLLGLAVRRRSASR